MELITPAPKPETVITYTFEFVFRPQALKIDVWPDQGDTVDLNPETGDFMFTFPRINFFQVVEKQNRITYSKEETKRLYVDAREMQKKMVDELRTDIAKRTGRVNVSRKPESIDTKDDDES